MCGLIAQLVEHRTGIAEVTVSNPIEALIFFFRLLYSNCLNWKFTAKITYHLHIYPQFIYESFHIQYIISLLSRENMNSQLTSLPMCGFIAQLVEHRTGIAEVTGSNPVEALIFFGLLYSNCLNWKFTAKITYHLLIIPLLRNFTILAHENAQNMTRYYTVEQVKNTDGKQSNKMAGQNVPKFDSFTSLMVICQKILTGFSTQMESALPPLHKFPH